ncbi:Methyltransferase type 11 [Ignicoccus hospitalis KIN4/I]|uniref:Methyltransferase type 11 n=1 Tax=Ignicoccus hospitalis (strain KIN4/I / DSM 18386 / JCM 14125) TaxID=453591 RepID=A8AAH9_IGNH4|nr:Methyltransferase type 11 [Ignicoccus hospitalis KIN4/I]
MYCNSGLSKSPAGKEGVHAGKKLITRVLERIYPLHDEVVAVKFVERGYYQKVARELEEGSRILEVGCGTGRFIQTVTEKCYGIGLDISDKLLRIAKERLEEHPFDCVLGTATALPFRSNSFKAVVTFTMMHHLTDQEKVTALKEIARVSPTYLFGEVGKNACWSAVLLKIIGSKKLIRKEIIERAGLKVREWHDMGGFCLIFGRAERT